MSKKPSLTEKFTLVPHSEYQSLIRRTAALHTGAGTEGQSSPSTSSLLPPVQEQVNDNSSETFIPPPGLPATAVEEDQQTQNSARWIDVWQMI